MSALATLAVALVATLVVGGIWAAFVLADIKAAFDGLPGTYTASGQIKGWRRRHGLLGYLLLALPLVFIVIAGAGLIGVGTYLVLHLELELL